MRLFPVVKPGMTRCGTTGFFILAAGVAFASLLPATPSFAQAYVSGVPPLTPAVPTYNQPGYSSPYQASPYQQVPPYQTVPTQPSPYANSGAPQPPMNQQQFMQALSAMQQQNPTDANGNPINPNNPNNKTQPAFELGDVNDPNSHAYKVNKLATQAQQERDQEAGLGQMQGLSDNATLDQQTPPPDVQALQQVNQTQAGKTSISDDPVNKQISLDMRKAAQKEAALSYGARGGLAKRNFQIMERMQGFDKVLDRVFDFRALLIKAPSGLLIEPPIIKESVNAVVVTNNGDEAAVADKVFDINKKAKIVTAPRDWRQYLIQSWSLVPPPPRVLWPKNAMEQADWSTWVSQGWLAGTAQADEIFEANVNQLTADYNGMVRYRMLLAQDMISAPYAMHEDRGVTGNTSQMRVGDRAVRITGPSQFLTKAELWKPADQ